MIPKIIWQTHESRYEDLLPFQKNITSTWKILNPDWEYMYSDSKQRENDVKDFDKYMHSVYLTKKKTTQVDIWRCVMLYQNGGFYADMDSCCTSTLNSVVKECCNNKDMISSSPGFQTSKNNNFVNNSNFACIKNSKIMKLILEDVVKDHQKTLKSIENKTWKKPKKNEDLWTVWNFFSNRVLENKNDVCYEDNYFIHSEDFKYNFDLRDKIFYNEKETTYLDLLIKKNFTIY
jgi:mannosyltransferase OCH1-like enzyme